MKMGSSDTALSQPLDEAAEARRVGGELADGVGAVGSRGDADPVAGVADVDAGGVGVLDRQGGEFGELLGLGAGGVGQAGRGRRVLTRRLADDHAILRKGGEVAAASGGGVGTGNQPSQRDHAADSE